MRLSFWLEAVCAVLTGVLLVLTLLWRDWIEGIFGRGADIDKGGGELEWLVVVGLAAISASSALLASSEWKRFRTSPRLPG